MRSRPEKTNLDYFVQRRPELIRKFHSRVLVNVNNLINTVLHGGMMDGQICMDLNFKWFSESLYLPGIWCWLGKIFFVFLVYYHYILSL